MHEVSQGVVLLAGAIAGFTIYLGLPVALLRVSLRWRLFLSAGSVGVLLFLFVEISYQVMEQIESILKLAVMGYRTYFEFYRHVGIFIFGFAFALVSLLLFEIKFIRKPKGEERSSARRMALMIAFGIGLHNFSEGLVIGQQFSGGALALGYLLVVGFALHNATEGFGIAAPLVDNRPSFLFLFMLGLIGGGPTFLGTFVGTQWTSEIAESLFLSLAAGAILYVVGELIHLGRVRGGYITASLGLLFGFFVAFGSDLVIEKATTSSFLSRAESKEIQMYAGDFFFKPSEIHLEAGKSYKLVVSNQGEVDHEVEFLGLGEEIEQVVPWKGQTAVLLAPRHGGRYPFICDMPGHLSKGMQGSLVVH